MLSRFVAAILDSIFSLLASRTLIARFVDHVDRLNAVLVLPFVAWVPGGWVASTLVLPYSLRALVMIRYRPLLMMRIARLLQSLVAWIGGV
jgi:hypothetical protein